MARDAKTVAAELMDLVSRSLHDPDRCKSLLAVKLEVIYDYAYALGYTTGKRLAKDFAYDLGFTDGFTKATESLGLPNGTPKAAPKSLTAGDQKPPQAAEAKTSKPRSQKRDLYHLPCEVCGALYSEDECPVCKARLASN